MSIAAQIVKTEGATVALLAALKKMGGEIELTESEIIEAASLLRDEHNNYRPADQVLCLTQESMAYVRVTDTVLDVQHEEDDGEAKYKLSLTAS